MTFYNKTKYEKEKQMNKVVGSAMIVALTALVAFSTEAGITIQTNFLSEVTRPSVGEDISGITYAGGDLYYCVDDK